MGGHEAAPAAPVLQQFCGLGLVSEYWLESSGAAPLGLARPFREPRDSDVAAIQAEAATVVAKVRSSAPAQPVEPPEMNWGSLGLFQPLCEVV